MAQIGIRLPKLRKPSLLKRPPLFKRKPAMKIKGIAGLVGRKY